MGKRKEEMFEKLAEMQMGRITVVSVGIDSADHAHAYVVKGDRLWYVKDSTLTPIEMEGAGSE